MTATAADQWHAVCSESILLLNVSGGMGDKLHPSTLIKAQCLPGEPILFTATQTFKN